MRRHIDDLMALAGVVALCYGAWLIYEPAGVLVLGLGLVAGSLVAGSASKP